MGILELTKALSTQRLSRPAHDGLTVSVDELKISSSQQAEDSQCAGTAGPEVALPEDILYHIHAIMPMQDAARAACLSHSFLRSWRCYPRLIFDTKSLCINEDTSKDRVTKDFISRVDNIMQNHSGIGVKMFKLQAYPCLSLCSSYVDRWLQIAISPGIEELELHMIRCSGIEYNFPYSLLSSERGSSIQSFALTECSFHPTLEVGCLSSLTSVCLSSVHITGEELCCFLSNCSVLEQLDLRNCNDIVFLQIPSLLSQIYFLQVKYCKGLQMIEANSPNLSYFDYSGRPINISFGDSSQLRVVQMLYHRDSNMLYDARTKLPSIAPNLQTLHLWSSGERVNTPIILDKFFHLKHLEIGFVTPSLSPDFDYYSLVSFIDASPALETFILRVEVPTDHDSIDEDTYGDSFHPRCLPEYHHENLRNIMINGFCSSKSMIELTRHILERATSLESLTLDTTRGCKKSFAKIGKCLSMNKKALLEAEKACIAIRRYVEARVPSTVNLKVIEPCGVCIRLIL